MRYCMALLALLAASSAGQEIKIRVDATDAPRRLIHVSMNLPVKPGPVTLAYPKWIPGEHMPSGPITNLVGLTVKSAGQTIPWTRDNVNMYAFHVLAPPGASSLDIAFDFIAPAEGSGDFTASGSTTTQLAVLNWYQTLLYPEGVAPDQLQAQATLKVPKGWRYGTALPIKRESGDEVEFQPAPLSTLADSPISTGANYKTIELGAENGASHFLHIAADSARATELSPELTANYKRLVTETGALFGSRHYRSYHFLLTLSDHVAHFGVEHHESSDDRLGERAMIDPSLQRASATLLPHEFVHSWNGKFRRPSGLVNGGFEAPMKGDLLWVYEGLTNYLGEVLAARSGLWTPEDYREALAETAAMLDTRTGREWRPLEDTAIAAQLLYGAGDDYAGYRRSVDFYPEGSLIWLETDVKIRQMSNGTKSLNDFCRRFHGGPGGAPALKPYTFEDLAGELNAIQPYDWAGFLHERVRSTSRRAPLGGVEGGGWKLVFSDKRSELWLAREGASKVTNLSYSAGLKVREDGSITDVTMDGPAGKAGVAPGTRLIAVNSRQFTPVVLREAIEKTASGGALELLVKSGEYFETHRLDYHGGERYPHLERNLGTPDLLTAIISPMAKQ